MPQQKPPELVPGDRHVRQTLLIIVGLYVLAGLWLEPLIDLFLSLQGIAPDPIVLAQLNQQKQWVAAMVFGVYRMLPELLFLWVGWRIIASASIPPARMRFPITVPRISGRQARMFGLLLVFVALGLVLYELQLVARTLILER